MAVMVPRMVPSIDYPRVPRMFLSRVPSIVPIMDFTGTILRSLECSLVGNILGSIVGTNLRSLECSLVGTILLSLVRTILYSLGWSLVRTKDFTRVPSMYCTRDPNMGYTRVHPMVPTTDYPRGSMPRKTFQILDLKRKNTTIGDL